MPEVSLHIPRKSYCLGGPERFVLRLIGGLLADLNVFIDGSWLFRQCGPTGSLAYATDRPSERFPLDFNRLNQELLRHVESHGHHCDGLGELIFAASILSLPSDLDDWPKKYPGIRPENIEITRKAVWAREALLREAKKGGYSDEAVLRPDLREWTLRKLIEGRFQEKQVDSLVVALLVRAAITRPDDFHVLITGDADLLPAIRVAHPGFTANIFVATTHPDELDARHRQTSYSLVEFGLRIPPYFMQNKGNAERIIEGAFPYRCEECGHVFVQERAIARAERPRCSRCRPIPRGRQRG